MLTKQKPKISVIIPVYNVEKYLRKCLDSLLNQTFKDIEIICINDGSPDNSLNILNEYASKDERIIVISQENQGPGAARNKGLEIAQGEYLSFIDPDDWVSQNFLESLYKEASKFDCDIVKGRRVDVYPDKSAKKESLPRVKNYKNLQSKIFLSSWWSCLYKAELIKKYNMFFPNTMCYEDIAFLIPFLTVSEKYSIAKDADYNYFHRSDSLCSELNRLDRAIQALDVKMTIFDFLQSKNLSKKDYIKGMSIFAHSFLYSINNFIDYGFENELQLVFTYVDKIINNLKYREEFVDTPWYKTLCVKNYTKDITLYNINLKFKSLSFFQKLFFMGNTKNYKLLSILGLRFVFKRS